MGVLAAGYMLAGSWLAHAQAPDPSRLPPGAVVQPLDQEPGAEHRRNLTTLANNPRSVAALIGAGRSALALGDGQAALSFFARADEIEPRNPRVKAGMASAMVMLERGSAALALFREAETLGAPLAEIAADRGLAYDMTGDPRRAQQDYALVLRRGDDDEVRRRMALSLAISGRREEALAMIEPQLRRQDRAAWRTQAFVLALTGDTTGANQTAARMLPGGGQSMAPFFARLASLSPAQKALAVHFGSFPADGRAMASANVDTSPDPGAIALARNDMPAAVTQPRAVERRPVPAAPVQRRRPDSTRETRQRSNSSRPAPASGWELAGRGAPPVSRRFEPPRREPEPEQPKPEPVQAEAEPVARSEYRPLPPSEPVPTEGAEEREIQLADGSTLVEPGFTLTPGSSEPASEPALPPPAETVPSPAPGQAGGSTGLGDLGSVLQGISDEEAPPAPAPQRAPPRVEPRQTRTAEARTTTPRPAVRRPAQPSRRWVQIATVPDRAALAREFSRLRTRAPEALRNRSAYMAPFGRSSSRLLVGPFETPRAAQELVSQLGRANVSAFAWTSEAGQEIDRVQTANDSRTARNRAEPAERPAARGARGRSQPEPRTPARGRRTR